MTNIHTNILHVKKRSCKSKGEKNQKIWKRGILDFFLVDGVD